MTSIQHQILAFWVARKMSWDGYWIAGFDGQRVPRDDWNRLPPPPIFRGVRPDVWGYDDDGTKMAIGEAKTGEDVDTAHTHVQLRIFKQMRAPTGVRCRLYIAVPHSSMRALDRVLARLGLIGFAKSYEFMFLTSFFPKRRLCDR
jgi:hypothetical protein